jgi:chorismate lyase/3-hydroxybenzoate synthase
METPLIVHYDCNLERFTSPEYAERVLGVVGYNTGQSKTLHPATPFARAPLRPAATGGQVFEVWTASTPTTCVRVGAVAGACSEALAFGTLIVPENKDVPLESAVESAYLSIFDFLDQTGFGEPIRFWNYLTAITADENGLERYRRFNIGRQRAFLARLAQPVPPVASCVGGHEGVSVIYFLAARSVAVAIENPRQISAYAYPPVYGPTSPSFSRASLHAESLFISGTASIVGHETRHRGDMRSQLTETMENLHTLIEVAGYADRCGTWAIKAYLRDPSCSKIVDEAITRLFGAQSQRLHLHGDLCRNDLLLEIEACHFPER